MVLRLLCVISYTLEYVVKYYLVDIYHHSLSLEPSIYFDYMQCNFIWDCLIVITNIISFKNKQKKYYYMCV